MDQRYGTEVWNRGMEQRYGTDSSRRYGTGVWNGGMERGYGTGVVPELVPDLLF